jgi:4-cresol dehydrogenase (hydroxylating)
MPPGLSPAEFASALTLWRQAIGAEWVLDDPARLAPYHAVMLPVDETEHAASAVVMPASVDELRAVLAVATRWRIPLWPVSTGRNFGYGSAAPATRGQVVLDMHRMNRILEVDGELGTALVEPGVTYRQLQEHLKERGLALWLDFPAPGPLVGPVGNTLERGGGLTPYGDHFANSCGMEVMLADGTLLRTGMGGVAGTTSWQCFKYGFGPVLDGLFTQSNFGVVTKLGMWLMPAPPAHKTFVALWHDERDLARAVDAIRPLRLDGTIPNFGILVNPALVLGTMTTRAALHPAGGRVPDAVLAKAAAERKLAPWAYSFSLYGHPEQIAANEAIVRRGLQAAGATVVGDIEDPMQSNVLSLQTFKLLNWSAGGGLAWFSPVCPTRGADMQRQCALAKSIMDRHGVEMMIGATVNGREMLNVMPIVYDRADAGEKARVKRCMHELIDAFATAGYGFYRTGIGFMDQVARVHGKVNFEVNRRLKRALDPAGILAPGKSGIRV